VHISSSESTLINGGSNLLWSRCSLKYCSSVVWFPYHLFLQSLVEMYAMYHRLAYVWMDEWIELSHAEVLSLDVSDPSKKTPDIKMEPVSVRI
jgi:hypothetical protein